MEHVLLEKDVGNWAVLPLGAAQPLNSVQGGLHAGDGRYHQGCLQHLGQRRTAMSVSSWKSDMPLTEINADNTAALKGLSH